MARYTGSIHKLCRREGVRLCNAKKCPLDKQGAQPPGQHGKKYQRRMSDYGVQLREKQKVKRIYGVLEKQFKRYYKKALKNPANTGLRLLQLLETRLDNVVFRANLAPTRRMARQLVSHGHVKVDDQKVDIPSYQVKPGEIITVKDKVMNIPAVQELHEEEDKLQHPSWLQRKATLVKIKSLPSREEIADHIDEQLIIEYYSR